MIGYVVGNYKITEKIGEGGMGAVFKGIDMMLEREVAIKMLRPELASQPQVVERFRSEAVTLAKLNHPNIATLFSFLRQGEDFFMVMEYVRGETLDSVIRKHGAMSIERAIAMFCQALEGIEHAHRLDIIHRDIKPANMMLTDTGTIKVMDFGIARVLGTSRLTRQGSIVGTIEYMSPEQVRGEETDARSDIYSLGILLYEMLTGRVPFQSDSEFALMKSQIEDAPTPPRSFAMHIPLVVEQAIMRSLAKKPDARYQTAGEFRAVLLQGIGALSGPVDHTKSTYAAPSTRLGDAYAAPSTMPDSPVDARYVPPAHLKETVISPGAPQPGPQPVGQLKETRLTDPAQMQYPAPQQAPYPPPHQYTTAPVNQQQQTSLLSKLNWMHYAGAAVVLLALITVPLALMASRSNQAAAPPAESPAATQSAPAAQAAPTTESQNSAVPQPATQTAPIADENAPASGAAGAAATTGEEAGRSARPRESRSSRAGQTETAAETPSQPAPTPPPVAAPAPKEDKPAVAETKPAEEKKEEKKKGSKIGGFFKKIVGIDDDKKKNENKNQQKKP
jgi:serine/threonine-protein kinase